MSAGVGIVALDWDREQFGIRVGTIDLDQAGAEDVLAKDAEAYDLIYARSRSERVIGGELLETLHGALVDRRVTFARDVAELEVAGEPPPGEVRSIGASDAYSARAVELAPQAARYSRFRADPAFPAEWTDSLYRLWMQNSLSRERADDVLGYIEADRLLGFYTIRVAGEAANLELFAVDEPARGRGIGTTLLAAGLRWMKQRGLARATVTTQLENPACSLYRACGYSEVSRESIYHLWPRGRVKP